MFQSLFAQGDFSRSATPAVQYGSERSNHIAGLERDIGPASAVYPVAKIPAVADHLGGSPGRAADRPDTAFFGVLRRWRASDSRNSAHRLRVLAQLHHPIDVSLAEPANQGHEQR